VRDRHPPRLRAALLARGGPGARRPAALRGGVPHRDARDRRQRPGARDEHPAPVAVDGAVVGRGGRPRDQPGQRRPHARGTRPRLPGGRRDGRGVRLPPGPRPARALAALTAGPLRPDRPPTAGTESALASAVPRILDGRAPTRSPAPRDGTTPTPHRARAAGAQRSDQEHGRGGSMRALRKTTPGPGLEWTDVEEPGCGPWDVKVRVLRAGICGTDLHILDWDASAEAMCGAVPFTPGHEVYGEEVGDVRVGDRISGEGHVVCGVCRNCRAGRRQMCIRTRSLGVQRDGAFAEYVTLPHQNVWVHEHDGGEELISPELGAVFDPLGNAVHTALKFEVVGEDVLITGAGPIGQMAAAVARHAGARYITITDISPQRLAMAEGCGADVVLDVASMKVREAQRSLGMREGFDVGLEIS